MIYEIRGMVALKLARVAKTAICIIWTEYATLTAGTSIAQKTNSIIR